ncbi:MAG: hypothetical protein JXQ73_09735 [Phycisphaerae bacterium]|nr:hypothetical protein [Phycisphaerae bacterium]
MCMNEKVKRKLLELYDELQQHDGFGDLRIEIRIMKRNQKEVIIHCGKQYRFVVDYLPSAPRGSGQEVMAR